MYLNISVRYVLFVCVLFHCHESLFIIGVASSIVVVASPVVSPVAVDRGQRSGGVSYKELKSIHVHLASSITF